MDSGDQAVFVLRLVLTLGPLAVYFLGLGLVNSQARPCVVRSRPDFVVLTIAFVPVVVAPVVMLIEQGLLWLAAGAIVVLITLFFAMLPGRREGWVIYNVSPDQCRRLLERACRRLGWTATGTDDELRVTSAGLIIHSSAVPWLRNATVRIEGATDEPGEHRRDLLIQALCREADGEAMLPSPAGASMVVIGATLLGVPMWYLFHHMDAVVAAVRQILVS